MRVLSAPHSVGCVKSPLMPPRETRRSYLEWIASTIDEIDRILDWLDYRKGPGPPILLAACIGVALAWAIVSFASAACDSLGQRLLEPLAHMPRRGIVGWVTLNRGMCEAIGKNPPWLLLSGLITAPSLMLTWYWRDRKRRDDHALALEGKIAERYTKAAEMLAHTDMMTRIAGLYSLWDVARESPSHRVTVARTLAAFIRTKSPISDGPTESEEGEAPSADIYTAAHLVSAHEWSSPEWYERGSRVVIDLRKVDLTGCDFTDRNLAYAHLDGACLVRATLSGANLNAIRMKGGTLAYAELSGASLDGAVLFDTNMREVDLNSAKLQSCLMTKCDLTKADFTGAIFFGTVLTHCNLRGARFLEASMRESSLTGSTYDQHTKFPSDYAAYNEDAIYEHV